MISLLIFVLALGAISLATNEQKIPQRIPLELLNRCKILAGGGWGLSVSTCPVRTSGCDTVYCPNSSVCASSLLGSWASQACCSDTTDDYSTLPVTSFCEDHMWPTWWLPGETDLGYFSCLEGEGQVRTGFQSQTDTAEAGSTSATTSTLSTITPTITSASNIFTSLLGLKEASGTTPQVDTPEPVGVGMKCAIKNLYEGPTNRFGDTVWVDKYPDHLEEPAENAETAGYALLIRNRRSRDNSKKLLVIDSIVVQSPFLKSTLGSVLKDYPGITTELKRLMFYPPFQPFIHRWDELVNATEKEQDPKIKQHLDLFFETMHGEIKGVIAAKKDLISYNVITFELIWTIFRPGDIIFSLENGKESCCKLKYGSYSSANSFGLACENVDWSGTKFGRSTQNKYISSFDGTKPITQLQAFPLAYHPERKSIKAKLITRGKKFEELRGYHLKAYNGNAIGNPARGVSQNFYCNSRIIIDAQAYNRFNGAYALNILPLNETKQDAITRRSNFLGAQQPVHRIGYHYDSYDTYDAYDDYDAYGPYEAYEAYNAHDAYGAYSAEDEDENPKERHAPLTEEQLLLTSPMVKGYSLKDKIWENFFVDLVREIEWSNNAFESLVLPEGHRELILAFAEGQLRYKKTFDDFIQGKGRGIIMLLSGPPGVGKTLTAESVAENMRVPLYAMSAGDLGLDPSTIESKLSNIFEMVTKWNAILLLDEADVFLEQRSPHDLERNKLVSIFLRVLEYYEGILFLTTNRVQTFDAAFNSRIHITINYPELSASSRRHIWGNFLAISGQTGGITEGDLDALAEIPINGRQIKNVIKTATLIAMRRNATLHREHIRTVMSVMENIKW